MKFNASLFENNDSDNSSGINHPVRTKRKADRKVSGITMARVYTLIKESRAKNRRIIPLVIAKYRVPSLTRSDPFDPRFRVSLSELNSRCEVVIRKEQE